MDSLLDDAFELLELAHNLEKEARPIDAATRFYEATYLMKRFLQKLPQTPSNNPTRQLIESKIEHYNKLASALLNQENMEPSDDADGVGGSQHNHHQEPESPFSKHCQFFDDTSVVPVAAPNLPSPRFENASTTTLAGQANTRLAHALDLDEAGSSKREKVIQEYVAAAELFLQAIKMSESSRTSDGADSVTSLLKRRLAGALDRVEQLKHPQQKRTVLEERKVKDQQKQKLPKAPLSEQEIAVLKRSSLIASGLFLPWSDEDARELSMQALQRPTTLYTDPDGFLKLSDKQRARFHKWARPPEICAIRRKQGIASSLQKPVMISQVTPYTIRQQYVTDCSFIASLCICAAYERRFGRKIVSAIPYPQNEECKPIISPSGKYIVRLWLNGVARQVIVDDFLPIDKFGNLLCSHTSTTSNRCLELWVSIIEKAYMKLCGGYDFPGSNSGVDLFSLTGWIPERIHFPKNSDNIRDFETPTERAWERLCSASSYGDCLVTMSTTADLDEKEANQVGLVTGHAYAVLSVVETRNGTRLLQLKNPWAHKSWKGKYSCHDLSSWESGLCEEVGYDPVAAQKHDDGVFYIGWNDVLVYFRNIHLSWNPALFSYQTTVHGFWPLKQGPVDDTFNVGENPQYVLKLSNAAISKKAAIWILLSRHVTKQEQEGSDATDYLTLHAHRNNGNRNVIWYPGGKNCVLNGAYTNNPHVLMRYDVTDPADKHLSLVLSQYKKSHDLGYTLSCYCTEAFALTQPAKGLPFSQELSGEWTLSAAGGPPGLGTFQNNPMWAFKVPSEGAYLQLKCSTSKSLTVNVMAVSVDAYRMRVKQITREPALDSGDYRHGFTVTERRRIPCGIYTLIVSTFNQGQCGSFVVGCNSSTKLKFERIP